MRERRLPVWAWKFRSRMFAYYRYWWHNLRASSGDYELRGLQAFAPKPTRQPQTDSEKRLAQVAKLAGVNAYNFVEFMNGDVQFNISVDGWITVHEFTASTLNMNSDSELYAAMMNTVRLAYGDGREKA